MNTIVKLYGFDECLSSAVDIARIINCLENLPFKKNISVCKIAIDYYPDHKHQVFIEILGSKPYATKIYNALKPLKYKIGIIVTPKK